MWDKKSSLGPHSPIRLLASKAGRPGWEERIWVIILDTGLNMNQQADLSPKAKDNQLIGRHAGAGSLPHIFFSPRQSC